MLSYQRVIAFLSLLNYKFVPVVSANYCEFGLCEKDEYCCGTNQCCWKYSDLQFLWIGAVVLIVGIAVAIGIRLFWKHRYVRMY